MIPLVIINFIAFIVCFSIGVYVFYKSGKKLEHRLFLALCLINSWMAICVVLFIQAKDPSLALFWARASIAPGLAVSITLHFVLVFTGKAIARKQWFLLLLYIPNILYYFYIIGTNDVVKAVIAGRWGNEIVYNMNSPFVGLCNLWTILLGLASLVIPIVYFFRTKDKKRKKQAFYITLGFFLPTVLGSLVFVLIPIAGDAVSKLPPVFMMFLEILFGYAIWRFGLLDLNPATAARNIIETMSDLMIIVDRNRRIVSYNSALLKLSQYPEREIVNRNISDYFTGKALSNLLNEAGAGEEPHHRRKTSGENKIRSVEDVLLTKNRQNVPVDISVSILCENDGVHSGYVLVARDITSKKKEQLEKERLIAELQEAMENVKTLKGLIPICANCKKVRDDQGFWNQIESYVSKHSEALFSHGICPECAKKLYGINLNKEPHLT
jgi:PAS domain S-box-containing protein